jgi:hypothetical protein
MTSKTETISKTPPIDRERLSPSENCYCRRCLLHDDPGGCLEVQAYERELHAQGMTAEQFIAATGVTEDWALRAIRSSWRWYDDDAAGRTYSPWGNEGWGS